MDASGTTFTISCVITGLTQAATTVIWQKDGTTNLGAGFTPDVGSGGFDADTGTQTTTLSVDGSDTARADMLFTCKVTDPAVGEAEVNLNFYSKYY